MKQSSKIRQIVLGWPGIAQKLQSAENLIIIPDEFLYRLPFTSLISDTVPQAPFLVQHAEISIVPAFSLIPDKQSAVWIDFPQDCLNSV